MSKEDNEKCAKYLCAIGTTLGKLGKLQEAEDYLTQGLNIRIKLSQRDQAQSLMNMGAALLDLKRTEKALDYYMQAYEMRQKLYPKDDLVIAETMKSIGISLNALKRLPEAKSYLKQAFEIYKTHYSSDHPTRQQVLSTLLPILQDLGDLEYYLYKIYLNKQ